MEGGCNLEAVSLLLLLWRERDKDRDEVESIAVGRPVRLTIVRVLDVHEGGLGPRGRSKRERRDSNLIPVQKYLK
jgi:hypothetical protein